VWGGREQLEKQIKADFEGLKQVLENGSA